MAKNTKKLRTWLFSFFSLVIVMALGASVLTLQYYSIQNSNKELNSKISVLEKDKNALKTENEANKQAINELESKLNSTQSDLKSKEQIASDLKKENEELKKELDGLKNTKAPKSEEKAGKSLAYYKSQNTGPKVCYLTFDDGPSENTLKILNVLKAGNAKATFFVMNTKNIEYVSKINEAGHTVGLHTNTHEWSIYKTEKSFFADLSAIEKKVESITGNKTNLIRFPGGSSNLVSKKYNKGIMTRLTKKVLKKGYFFFDWNVDSGDAERPRMPVNKILENIKTGSKGKDEICILMHDTSSKNTSVEALPYIISYLRSEGFRFEALNEKSSGFHHKKLYN